MSGLFALGEATLLGNTAAHEPDESLPFYMLKSLL
jgi:hypothetical protein